MRIEEYFHQIDAVLALFPQVALKTMSYDQRSDTKGFIRGVLLFDDGSELHVREFVDVSAGIERFKYSYHYMRGGHLVFRYDNAADITARDFATYPHHKHVGEVIQACAAPTLQEVLEEIVAHLV
jgi:hypothetical protein